MKWRIYYGDGTAFSDRDGSPFQAPPAGVIVIAFTEGEKTKLAHSKDYYLWREDGWYQADMGGLWGYLLLSTGPKYVLAGRTIRTDEYLKIVSRAVREGVGDG